MLCDSVIIFLLGLTREWRARDRNAKYETNSYILTNQIAHFFFWYSKLPTPARA